MSDQMIHWQQDEDGVVVLTIDEPGSSVNKMGPPYLEAMGAVVDRLEAEREAITGVVIASAKSTWVAGADLDSMRYVTPETSAEFGLMLDTMKAQFRRLETLGIPVVAAINGVALGGGFELALACHRRIAVDDPRVKVGLPEVHFGLLPAGGGVTRTVRMLGLVDALTHVLVEGQRMTAAKARTLGLIDELVDAPDDLVPAAKAWIATGPAALQPWDVKGFRIPGGTPATAKLAEILPSIPASVRKRLGGSNYPAPKAIVAVAVEGSQVGIDRAFEIETRYLTAQVTGAVTKNLIQAFFFDAASANGPRGRPTGDAPWRATKAVVLGAGMMGAAIAYVCAKAGIEVVLKDVSQEAADRGRAYSERLVAAAVERGRTSPEHGDALRARITATTDPAAAQGADLVIEAVFEDPAVKAEVFAEIEPFLAAGALLGSNTSSLPITELAEGVGRPSDFIGLHFFSPVDRMPLLEIVKGARTSDDALGRALDLAKQIGKTPIVVNDARGFFTSRVIGTYIDEGLALLGEGVPAASVEQASTQAGYPAPVLRLSDELNLRLMRKIRQETQAGTLADGDTWTVHPAEAVLDAMLDEHERPGRLAGAGFYTYEDGRRVGLWSGLPAAFGSREDHGIPFEDMKERMLFIETLETIRCLDEGVLETVADANVGSILGIGYPAWTGGVLQFTTTYPGGLAGFVSRARELAGRYGERFTPPASLVARAAAGEPYTDERQVAHA